ncbi:MAG TPA: hypothetical protein VLM38_07255 [Blastocatellia bacterium]|nr:hypothetical protein [Blastocatellia bacterium]
MNGNIAKLLIPDGQERLATQGERDDVNRTLATRSSVKTSHPAERFKSEPPPPRESGDQVNRFLLCALVKEASRHIKENARRDGNSLPMSIIVRGVLRSYRLAAMDKNGPLSGPTIDMAGLQRLNARVLKDETARLAFERVGNGRASLARAERLGDEARIKTERTELEHAIELTDRLAALH